MVVSRGGGELVIVLTGDDICVGVARAEVLDVVVHGGGGRVAGGTASDRESSLGCHGAEPAELESTAECPDLQRSFFK